MSDYIKLMPFGFQVSNDTGDPAEPISVSVDYVLDIPRYYLSSLIMELIGEFVMSELIVRKRPDGVFEIEKAMQLKPVDK